MRINDISTNIYINQGHNEEYMGIKIKLSAKMYSLLMNEFEIECFLCIQKLPVALETQKLSGLLLNKDMLFKYKIYIAFFASFRQFLINYA